MPVAVFALPGGAIVVITGTVPIEFLMDWGGPKIEFTQTVEPE